MLNKPQIFSSTIERKNYVRNKTNCKFLTFILETRHEKCYERSRRFHDRCTMFHETTKWISDLWYTVDSAYRISLVSVVETASQIIQHLRRHFVSIRLQELARHYKLCKIMALEERVLSGNKPFRGTL